MAAPHGRIEPGQPLEVAISARAWNRAQDAADIVFGAKSGMAAGSPLNALAPFIALPCRNNSASDVPRGGVLSIRGFDTLEIEPTSTATDSETLQFLAQPVLRGQLPTGREATFGIATQPIPAGAMGRVAVAGVVQVKIEVKSIYHWYATTKHGNVNELQTSASVGYPIIWKPSQTGAGKLALVRMQSPAQEAIRLGKISGGWVKGTTRTVTRYNGDGSEFDEEGEDTTFDAVNRFATIGNLSEVWVACALVDATWHLVAAEC